MIILTVQGTSPETLFADLEKFGDKATAAVEAATVAWLTSRGHIVTKAEEWESAVQIAQRLGLKPKTVAPKLRAAACPPYESRASENGGLLIRAYPALDHFLKS